MLHHGEKEAKAKPTIQEEEEATKEQRTYYKEQEGATDPSVKETIEPEVPSSTQVLEHDEPDQTSQRSVRSYAGGKLACHIS